MKYFVQTKHSCPTCKRESVDIVSTDEVAGLLYSGHFPVGTFKFCSRSYTEFRHER